MRENRPYGSEGGVGENRSLPLSPIAVQPQQREDFLHGRLHEVSLDRLHRSSLGPRRGWPGQPHGCPVHVVLQFSCNWRESLGWAGLLSRRRETSFLCIRLARTSRVSSRKPCVALVTSCSWRSSKKAMSATAI